MASLSIGKNGFARIQFVGPDGKRLSLWPGKLNRKAAERILFIVEALTAAAFRVEELDDRARQALGDIPETIRRKLVRYGLATGQVPGVSPKLAAFVDSYLASRTDLKDGTRLSARYDAESLKQYFRDKVIRAVTVADAKAFIVWMKEQGLAAATISRRVVRAKHFFAAAIDANHISRNPFSKIKTAPQRNPSRKHFVTKETTEKLLAACPDDDWRRIVALARYGGLRTPSETFELRWSDIDFARNRITIRSQKTEHLADGASRTIPLFPELVPYLKPTLGAEYVVRRRGDSRSNLRTHLMRIIKRAGLEPWPRLFQNLRASRETELADSYPLHVVCAWIGNTERVANSHYLQVTDDHFNKATTQQTTNAFSGNDSQHCSDVPVLLSFDAAKRALHTHAQVCQLPGLDDQFKHNSTGKPAKSGVRRLGRRLSMPKNKDRDSLQ